MQKLDLNGIKNIVFDLGGVIITLDRNEAVRRFYESGLKNAEELLDSYHQKGIFLELEEGILSREEFYEAIQKETGKTLAAEVLDWCWMGFMKDVPLSKLKILEDLRAAGYCLYLLSNTSPIVMEWALGPNFSAAGKPINAYFDKLYLSYQMKCVKPNAKIFRNMIDDSGVVPSETLFIDDGKANVEMGKQFGFKTYCPLNGENFNEMFT